MNKNKIEIAIVLQTGQRAELQLSPRSYKQNFRDFLKKYNIGGEQAIQLKKVIQLSLIEISKMKISSVPNDSFGMKQEQEQQKQQKRIQQIQHHLDSPRFPKPPQEEQVNQKQANKYHYQIDANGEKVQMNHVLSVQEDNNLDVPIISIQDIKNIHQEEVVNELKNDQFFPYHQQKIFHNQQVPMYCQDDPQPTPAVPPLKLSNTEQQQNLQKSNLKYPQTPSRPQQIKKIQSITKYQQSLPTGLKLTQKSMHSHKKTQNASINVKKQKITKKTNFLQFSQFKTKKQQKCLSQDRSTYDRLYYQHTDSFKSKKNQQINRKQLQDQIQVQKYDLNNRLKRTTKQFFYALHKRTTESWEYRNSKSKDKSSLDQTDKQYCTLPAKKIPIKQAFKGSLWQSRSRCQAHIYQEQLQKQQVKAKLKQVQVRKRIRQSKSKSPQKKEFSHQSRSCQKCSPKKIQIPKTKKNIIPKMQQKPRKKNYISEVLREAYQERIRQVRALNFI